jgi:hypothetical protein
MKNKILLICLSVTMLIGTLKAQVASVQVIHNCADAAADTVDVWISSLVTGKVKLLSKFAFRTATPFVSAPAGTPLRVVVTPKNSTDTLVKVKGFTYNLAANAQYILVASGIASTSGYMPSSVAAPFTLSVYTPAQQAAANSANTDVLVYHGATDAPMVSITSGALTLIPSISYSQFNSAGYLQLPTANYPVAVKSGTVTVASYSAPLQTLALGNKAITVLASGFLDPSKNSNGKSFGLWVALPSGGNLVELPNTTGINDIKLERTSLNFYPNPASDKINFSVSSLANEIATVKIYDVRGSIVFQTYNILNAGQNDVQLNVSGMEKGVYFVELVDSKKISIGKLIVE